MSRRTVLECLLNLLPSVTREHARTTSFYDRCRQLLREDVEATFADTASRPKRFAPFGNILFPYRSLGAIDTLNFFDLDELILYAYYWQNRHRYKRVADLGANIGLHSTLLSRCGFEVRSYEPDPEHFRILQETLTANGCENVTAIQAAVSDRAGTAEFVRVKNNTTGSHLAGCKPNPYGPLDRFTVDVIEFGPILRWADLLKIDVEGSELAMIRSTSKADWQGTDALLEIQDAGNAAGVWEHCQAIGLNLFAQKVN